MEYVESGLDLRGIAAYGVACGGNLVALQEYLENVLRTRDGWDDLYSAIREVI